VDVSPDPSDPTGTQDITINLESIPTATDVQYVILYSIGLTLFDELFLLEEHWGRHAQYGQKSWVSH
jgi:hypothetical protein